MIDKLIKNIPLKTRIQVLNEIGFIRLITEMGYREEKSWGPDEEATLQKLKDLAKEHTQFIMEELTEWEEDGRP